MSEQTATAVTNQTSTQTSQAPTNNQTFADIYRSSIENKAQFWAEQAKRIYWHKEPEQIQEQLEWLASFFGDALKAKMGITSGWINPDLCNGIQPFSDSFSSQALLKGHQLIQQTQRDLREVNAVNQELMLLNCLTKLVMDVFES